MSRGGFQGGRIAAKGLSRGVHGNLAESRMDVMTLKGTVPNPDSVILGHVLGFDK